MERIKENNLFCEECSLQFYEESVYDIHMSYYFHKSKNVIMQSDYQAKLVDIKMDNEDLMPQSDNKKQNINQKKQVAPLEIKQGERRLSKCKICGHCFSAKQDLKRHIEAVHENRKPHKCSFCDYSCSQKNDLNTHIASVHEGRGV